MSDPERADRIPRDDEIHQEGGKLPGLEEAFFRQFFKEASTAALQVPDVDVAEDAQGTAAGAPATPTTKLRIIRNPGPVEPAEPSTWGAPNGQWPRVRVPMGGEGTAAEQGPSVHEQQSTAYIRPAVTPRSPSSLVVNEGKVIYVVRAPAAEPGETDPAAAAGSEDGTPSAAQAAPRLASIVTERTGLVQFDVSTPIESRATGEPERDVAEAASPGDVLEEDDGEELEVSAQATTDDVPIAEDDQQARGRGRRFRKRSVSTEVATPEPPLHESEAGKITLGKVARFALSSAGQTTAEVGAGAQRKVGQWAADAEDRKAAAAALQAEREATFDAAPAAVQAAMRGLIQLASMNKIGIFSIGQIGTPKAEKWRRIIAEHGYGIDQDGYLIQLPDDESQEESPHSDQWPYKGGYNPWNG